MKYHSLGRISLHQPRLIRLLAMLLLSAGPCGAWAQCVYPPPGLVSWWSGDGTDHDLFGGNPGLLSSSGVTYAPGLVNQAFRLDGTNGYVQLPDNCFPYPTSLEDPGVIPFSFEVWFQTTSGGVILGQQERAPFGATDSRIPAIYVGTDGRLYAELFYTGRTEPIVSPLAVNDGVFHHVAATFDGTNRLVYLDGVAIGMRTGGQRAYGNRYYRYQLGTGQTRGWPAAIDGWYSFSGLIDEASFYNRAISAEEVNRIYSAGALGKCKPSVPLSTIYRTEFETPVGLEWSDRDTAFSPGNNTFLGEFGNLMLTLTLSNLPPHTNLTLAFDLLILDSWDGLIGPDLIDVNVEGGPTLLHSTFHNGMNGGPQSYPAAHRINDFPPQTGALEVNTLGQSRDARYRLRYTFPHSATNRIRLRFQGSGLQGLTDESWGLDNVLVYADGPTIRWTQPTNFVSFFAPTTLVLSATSAPTAGTLRYVQFLDNNVLLTTLTNAPYTMVWRNVPAGVHVIKAQAADDAGRTTEALTTVQVGGLLGEYYANTNLSGAPIIRLDPLVNFNWQSRAPIVGMAADRFSVRWTGELFPRYQEPYTLEFRVKDGVRLWIDGRRVLDDWQVQGAVTDQATFTFAAERHYRIQIDYFQNTGNAVAWFNWSSANQPLEAVPTERLFPSPPGINRPPNIPVVNVPGADGWAVTPGIDLPLGVDFFSDPDTGDLQGAANWQLYTLGASTNLVWFATALNSNLSTRLSNGVFAGSHVGLSGLLPNRDFLLTVRHRDDGNPFSWGDPAERYFHTRAPVLIAGPFVKAPYQTNIIIFGDTVTLGITATNIRPWVSYQWRLNGTNILDGTNDTLVVTAFDEANAGAYTVVAENPAGSTTSAGLTLTGSFAQVCGVVWDDRNANGILDLPLIRGERPDIIYVIDRSHSTVIGPFVGDPIGDINGDGLADTRLDAELAAFIGLNRALVTHGYATNARVAIIDFGRDAVSRDLNPLAPVLQFGVAPNADANTNGLPDVEEVLRSIQTNSVGGTDFHVALLTASNVFNTLMTPNGHGNLVFLSDGFSDLEGLLYTNDVAKLNEAGVYLRAFGAGLDANLDHLRRVDRSAQIFTNAGQLVEFFGGPTGSLLERELGLAGVTLYLDLNGNGQREPEEPIVVSDDVGQYCFDHLRSGTNVLRELLPDGFTRTYPAGGQSLSVVHQPQVSGFDFGLARQSRLTLLSSAAGGLELTFSRPGGINHRIEVSSNLVHWITLTNLSSSDATVRWTEPGPLSEAQRFYRAVQR